MSCNINVGETVIILHGSNKHTIGLVVTLINDLLIIRTESKRVSIRSCAVKSLRHLAKCL
ncbi:MAG: hypothetical protein ACTS5F_00105 [Candidatus Hodgkinia cicadicola]